MVEILSAIVQNLYLILIVLGQNNLNYYMYLQSHHGQMAGLGQPIHNSLAASLMNNYGPTAAHVTSL
jgi:hypothetical protein